MKIVKFYLRPNADKQGKCLIYARYTYAGNKLRISTEVKIHPKYWDEESQWITKNTPDYERLSAMMDAIEKPISTFYYKSIFDGQKPDVLSVQNALKQSTVESKGFFDLYEQFTNDKKSQVSDTRQRDYQTVKNHLETFQTYREKVICLQSIDYKFFLDFQNYLFDTYYLQWNSMVKYLIVLKTFLNYARRIKLINDVSYQGFSLKEKDPQIIALTKEELKKIVRVKLEDKRLDRVRDLFLFQCYTGRRYGVLKNYCKEAVNGQYWDLVDNKTGKLIDVPLIPPALRILRKYDFKLPVISNQNMNDYLKEVANIAGIDSIVNKYRYQGNKRIDDYRRKADVLSTHVAKRTFVTLSQENGLSSKLVEKITGNTPKTLKRYERLSQEYKYRETAKAWKTLTFK